MNEHAIISSLLDNDAYKAFMAQVIFDDPDFRDVTVRFELINRTLVSVPGLSINETELRRQLDHVTGLRFTVADIAFLRTLGCFTDAFLAFLSPSRFALPEYEIFRRGSDLVIAAEGPWPVVTWLEVPALAVFNELYFSAFQTLRKSADRTVLERGRMRLHEKLWKIAAHDDRTGTETRFSDFGTRRRFRASWHDEVLTTIMRDMPELLTGTSNLLNAQMYGLPAIGTMAHELLMVAHGIARVHGKAEPARWATEKVADRWKTTFQNHPERLIFLPDTFGTDFALGLFGEKRARLWRGMRQDSGDPFLVGEKIVNFYRELDIDPLEHLIVFSDSLTDDLLLLLNDTFSPHVHVAFGWGTLLTNDVGFQPISLVMKPVEAVIDGQRVALAKLSDNPAKATGPKDLVAALRREVGYEDRPPLKLRA